MNTIIYPDEAKREKANSYQSMLESWAWKDFDKFLEDERKTSLELAINSEDMRLIQVNRGKVQQIDAIRSHLGYVLHEKS